MAASVGVDGGLTLSSPPIELIDPTAIRDNVRPGVALGIDIGFYHLFDKELGLGGILVPTLYRAGQHTSGGIDFQIGPRLVWRPSWFHLSVDGGFVLAAYEDRCAGTDTDVEDCPRTRESRASAPGFGLGLASMYRVASWSGFDALVGPALRYHWARVPYVDGGGGFVLEVFQAVVAVRLFADLGEVVSDD